MIKSSELECRNKMQITIVRKIDESGKDGTPNSLTLELTIYKKERIR